MTTALTFQTTHFDVIERNNQLWLTATDLAQALGYKSPKSISNIFARNLDEFSTGMTLVINLMTNGINGSRRRNETRIFSLRGAHLIAMFARTAIAKQFRKWVLDILDSHPQTQTITLTPTAYPNPIPDVNWPETYRTNWQYADVLLPYQQQQARFIRFELKPKVFSSEFAAKHTAQIYQAKFEFLDATRRPLKASPFVDSMIGDFGYFESTTLADLWLQVIGFAARCNSQCIFL